MEQIISFLTKSSSINTTFDIELAGITYPDPNYKIRRTVSDIYIIEYIIDGEGTLRIDGEQFTPRKGDVYLLPKGSSHEYFSSKDNPFHKIWMNVKGNLCGYLISAYKLQGIYFFEQVEADVYGCFKEFLVTCQEDPLSYPQIADKCSIILHQLLQKLASYSNCITAADEINSAQKVKTYLDSKIYEKVSLSDVAAEVNLSVSQLNRRFKQEFNQTVYGYALQTKIDTAMMLLRNTAMPVKEIAYLLRFTDEHYFSNIFKKKCAVSPKEYRSKCQS